MEINRYTVVFRGEIRDLDKNPFHIVSPFGEVVACGLGNEFSHADDLEEQIEALRAENARLLKALKPFADEAKTYWSDVEHTPDGSAVGVDVAWLRAARAAMGESDDLL